MPLLWAGLASSLVGIALGGEPMPLATLLGLGALLLARLARPRPVARYLVIVAVLPLAASYAAWRAPERPDHDLAQLAPRRWLRVVGTVATLPEPTAGGCRFVLSVERVTGPMPGPGAGRTAVSLVSGLRPEVGDRLELEGSLRRPGRPQQRGEGDDAARLAREGIFSRMQARAARRLQPAPPSLLRLAGRLRSQALAEIARRQPLAEAALLGSLLLGGGASPLDPELTDRFRMLGLAHVLAVSGAQVQLVLGAVLALTRLVGLPRGFAGLFALMLVGLYALMTGLPPSIARAVAMAALQILAWSGARPLRPGMALWAGAAGLLLIRPGWLFDLGFLYSMLATAALIEVAPRLAPLLAWLPGPLRTPLGAALATTLLVTPLQLGLDGQLSAWAIPANLILMLLIEALTLGGAALVPLGVLLTMAQLPAAWLAVPHALARLLLLLMQQLVTLLASWPGARLPVGVRPGWAVGLAYLGLTLALAAWVARRPRVTALGLALALVACLTRPALPAGLWLTVLAVGQGDAIVFRTPGGHWYLVDAGPAWDGGDAGQRVILPYLRRLGVTSLAGVILTHPHADHLGGMRSVLRGIPVRQVWDAGQSSSDPMYRAFLTCLIERQIPWQVVQAGVEVGLEPGLALAVLNPPATPFHGTRSDANNNAIALHLRYGSFRVLLASDLEREAEAALAHHPGLRSTVLKACHHGSRYGSTPAFLAAVRPRASLISVGARNTFRHPDPGTLRRLRRYGPVYRTDRQGALEVWSDGARWSITPRYPGGDAGG